MAASKIDVVFLHCDQGMGTLIRIYDSINRLTNLVLLDLGSESGTKKYATSAIDSVINALKQMMTDGIKPAIDLLVLSHQDTDHWSLLPELLKRIDKEVDTTKVKKIVYGGTLWKTRATRVLEKWEERFGVDADALARSNCSYKKPGEKGDIDTISGVAFRLLCTNAPISRSAEDLERNGTSAVVVVDFGGVTAILPGDATADTLGWINDNVFDLWKNKGKGNPVTPCRALGAPHHGALRTIASNFVAVVKKAKLTIADDFAANVATENVVASAGYESQFLHPYKEVLELLAIKASTNQDEHDWVWYDGTKSDWFRVTASKRGIFTTITTLDWPPKRLGWRFTITAKGEISFELDWEQAEVIWFKDRYPAVPRTF